MVVVVTPALMRDKPYTGESSFGQYYLYTVKDQTGVEFSFFAPAEIHAQILEAGLKTGDTFTLAKKAVQNGKQVGVIDDNYTSRLATIIIPDS